MGVDFAGPLGYKVNKNKEGKASIPMFTCSVTRAVHLGPVVQKVNSAIQWKVIFFKHFKKCSLTEKFQIKVQYFQVKDFIRCKFNILRLLSLMP